MSRATRAAARRRPAPRSAMFRSFSVVNYRIWFLGALISNVGGWMQATAQDWVVLTQLTDNDAGAVGITMALQFGPPLLLVAASGWVADRFDRRRLLMLTQTTLLLLAAAVGVLLLLDVMTLPLMFCFAAAFGVTNAFDAPARQTFVSDLVSRDHTSNAIALNAASFNAARMFGPAIGGILIVIVGTGWVFVVNAATFLAMLIALACLRVGDLAPRVRAPGTARMADGFRYVARRPDLAVTFVMVFLLGAFGMNFPIFASTMALEFGRNADGYGLLSSVLAIGSLAGALLAARRERARIRVVIGAVGAFGVVALVSSAMPTYVLYACALVFLGFTTVTTLTTANGYVQTTTDAGVRGRVMALYMAILMGGTPVGAPIIGAIADAFGPRTAIALGGAAGLVACAIGLTWLAVSGRLHREEGARLRLRLEQTRPIAIAEPAQFSDEVAATTPIRLPSGNGTRVSGAPTTPTRRPV